MKLTEYCDEKGIKWFPINLTIKENGEGKKIKTLNPYKETGYRPDMNDFKTDKYKKYKFLKGYEYGVIDTNDIQQIDIDITNNKKYSEEVHDFIAKNKQDRPYFNSIGKGNPHFLFQNELFENNRIQSNLDDIEFLTGQWSYIKLDTEIFNPNETLKTLDEKYFEVKKEKKPKSLLKLDNSKTLDSSNIIEFKTPSQEDIEILDNISNEYFSNYDDWLKLMWSIYNEFGDLELCDKYSKKGSNYSGIEEVIKIVNDDKKKLITFGTVYYYSKLSNKENFFRIKVRYSKKLENDTDKSIAKIYLNIVGDNVVKQNEELYIYKGIFWEKDETRNMIRLDMSDTLEELFEEQLKNVKNEIKELKKKEIDDESSNLNQEKILKLKMKMLNSALRSVNTSAKQKAITDQIYIILENKEYNFDLNTKNIFCFNNKSFNLDTNEEVKINKYDYVTLHTSYDYRKPSIDEKNKIMNFLEEILPNKDTRDCAISCLRRALQGYQDEYFILFNGQGGNGKGVLLELFMEILGTEYFYEGHNAILTSKPKTGANPEIANCNLKRCITFSEPDESEKLNASAIKLMSGNPVINARTLYSKNNVTNLTATIILQCNQRPKISGRSDAALSRRFVDILFPINFVNSERELVEGNDSIKLKDMSFKAKDFKDNHKFALFDIIFNSEYKNIYIPNTVSSRTNEFLCDNDDLLNWFNEFYEFTEDPKVCIKFIDLYQDFKISQTYQQLSNDEKRNEWTKSKFKDKLQTNILLKRFYRERIKIDGADFKSVLINYKKIVVEEEYEN